MVSIGGITRVAKAAGRLMFMDSKFCGKLESTLAASKKVQGWSGMHKQIGNAFKAAEGCTKNDSFWKPIWKQIKTTPSELSSVWKNSKGWWKTTKGIGGVIAKRLPLIFVAMEIPNIYSAFKDKGLVGGILETGKSVVRGAAGMAGFAIGQTLIPIPIVGGLIGAFAGDWLVSKIVGKSHSEQKAEAEEAMMQGDEQQYQQQMELMKQMQQQNPMMFPNNPYMNTGLASINIPRPTVNPQQLIAMQQALYGGGMTGAMDQDFMAMTSGMNRLGQNLNRIG